MSKTKKKVEFQKQEDIAETSAKVEFDAYKQYQEYFEAQQKQILEYWTTVLNNTFWWTKK